MATLAPIHPPLAVVPGFIATREIALIIPRERMKLYSDSFAVLGLDRVPILKVDGGLSIHDTKTYTDAGGEALFEVRYHLARGVFEAKSLEDSTRGAVLFTVDTVASATIHIGDTDNADVQNKSIDLLLEENALVFADNKQPLATLTPSPVHAEGHTAGAPGEDDSYMVHIAAGVDYAVVPAICVAFDELKAMAKE